MSQAQIRQALTQEVSKVTDYLLKRGFTKTEAIFRQESAHVGSDGRPIHQRVDQLGPKQYLRAFSLLKTWIENNLDLYKVPFLTPLPDRLR
jgi:transcription initiation factor TFIID subunit 5